ncbi:MULTISPECIES: helix-turn-helix transcriptional regulator [Arthrobacter]|jgi:predicted ArsR family transcriptional regulator|uniref:helix-turn-helix transcriptional regulator n=1 Tax=Arthrobacter sp. UNC362MFTsu5.1 TaxID=1449044 RepID=UPI0004825F92|nr:helix-turn-helix domain-containing protein [Arthrobacter sp. UNC362MFTsu5.1]
MRRLPWARRIAAVASLGDENRRKLFGFVSSSAGPVGRDEAAAALEIPRSTASFQLDRLVQDGVLTVEFRKLGGKAGPGSGRPAKLYRPAQPELGASVPDRNYDLAGELMAAAIERSSAAGEPVRDALLATSYAKGLEMAEGSHSLEDFLSAEGYLPDPDGAGGFALRNCPFHRLADGHADVVCAMNGAFLTGAAAGCGVAEDRIVGNKAAGQCCARVTPP